MKNNYIKAFLSLLMTAAMCMTLLSGCGNGTGVEESTTEYYDDSIVEIDYNELKLPFAKFDTLDPFRAESGINRQIITLMYDSLLRVNTQYEPIPLIASSYQLDGKNLTVRINSAAVFSDGSRVTADDVVYSYGFAKDSDAYRGRLSNFENVYADGSSSVNFTLSSADAYCASCLDFPIVKENTVQEEYETLEEIVPPTGSGRYTLSRSNGYILTVNNSRMGSFWPQISNIRLVNVSDSTALFYSLEIGNVNFAFDDLSSGEYKRAIGNSNEYQMNNLVFLGINQENSALADTAVRKAIALATDREEIVNTAYQGHASVSYTPFNPTWYVMSKYDMIKPADSDAALKTLEDAGYDSINTYNIRNDGSKSLTFKLIVNGENEFKLFTARIIASCLAKLNIHVSISALTQKDFLEAFELGEYDLYIGEINMTPNMSLSPFFASKGAVTKGIYSTGAKSAYEGFLTGKSDVKKFAAAFEADSPFVPICFRKGVVACTSTLMGATESNSNDIFGDIENWMFEQ